MATERCIVVGAGDVSGAWFPPLAAEGVRVDAVVDLNLGVAQAQATRQGLDAEVSGDLMAMLNRHSPDFVLDLTVPAAHCDVTCMALRSGAHVLGEKPMAASMEQARRMVLASEETGKLYMVSQSRRWDANRDLVRRLIASDAIGQISTVTCQFFVGVHPGGFREAMASPLMLDVAVHHFDLMRFMIGLDPVWVYAHEFNPSRSWFAGDASATVLFEMSNGAIFTYTGSRCSEGCRTSRSGDWRFIGQGGTMVYADDRAPYGEIVVGSEGIDRPVAPLEIPEPRMEFPAMHGALREMLAYLRHGTAPQTECHDNIRTLAMVFAAIESSGSGRTVLVPGS